MSRLDYLRPFAQASAEALAVFDVNSEETSAKFVRIGEILRSQKFHTEASMFFDAAFQKDRGSRDYLLAKLIEQFKVGVDMLESDLVALEQLDSGFHRYLRTELFRRANPDDHAGILTTAGNAHESFMSGSPADWIYIRAGIAVSGAAGHGREPSGKANLIPRRLFFYWDKDPPEEVVANFTYHQDNPDVETIVYTKEMSEDFLLQYYGKQARDLFLTLRHPAEESDFIRYHLIYTFGGYYLDADEQLISFDRLERSANGAEAIFILAASGPVENALFGAVAGFSVIEEALRIMLYNYLVHPKVSIWMKTGPGVLTRALVRAYYRWQVKQAGLANFRILPTSSYGALVRSIDVSYRSDARDWRVFERDNPNR